MASRRRRRKAAAHHRQAVDAPLARLAGGVQLAEHMEPLAYTRKQAAEALGVSLATFDRRVAPVIATVATEWGGRLIPVSELERYLAERTQPPRARAKPRSRPGRKAGVPPELVRQIRKEHQSGTSLAEIARTLNAEDVRTSQGGRQWWPSTVRAVLLRPDPPTSA